MNYVKATNYLFSFVRGDKIYLVGDNFNSYPNCIRIEGDLEEYIDQTLSKEDSNVNRSLVMVRVLEHLDITDYKLWQKIHKYFKTIYAITPNMLDTYQNFLSKDLLYYDYIKTYRAEFEIFNFHNRKMFPHYKYDYHKFFVTEEKLKLLPGYKGVILDELEIEGYKHFVSFHTATESFPTIEDFPISLSINEDFGRIDINDEVYYDINEDLLRVKDVKFIHLQHIISTYKLIDFKWQILKELINRFPNAYVKITDFDIKAYLDLISTYKPATLKDIVSYEEQTIFKFSKAVQILNQHTLQHILKIEDIDVDEIILHKPDKNNNK